MSFLNFSIYSMLCLDFSFFHCLAFDTYFVFSFNSELQNTFDVTIIIFPTRLVLQLLF